MLPMEYVIPTYRNDVDRDYSVGRVLATRMEDLEKVVETREDAYQANIKIQQQQPKWFQGKATEKVFNEGDLVLWHPKGQHMKPGKLTYRWFGPYRVQYALPNNAVLLVALRHFDKNAVIINSNKLKNYLLLGGTLLETVIPEEAPEDLVREIQVGGKESREDQEGDMETQEVGINSIQPIVHCCSIERTSRDQIITRGLELKRQCDTRKTSTNRISAKETSYVYKREEVTTMKVWRTTTYH